MSTITMEKSTTIRPHAKLFTPSEFKTKIKLDAILGNKEVMEFLKPTLTYKETSSDAPKISQQTFREHKAASIYQRERLAEVADRFDAVVSNQWKKNNPKASIPELDIQRSIRREQLWDANIPSVDKTYFYRYADEFISELRSDLDMLNDTAGDLLTDYYAELKYEPVALMTDYMGEVRDGKSYTNSKDMINHVINSPDPAIGALKASRGLCNYIGIVCKTWVKEYDNYQSYVLNSPRSDTGYKYVRYALLIGD